jgi:hypothetical protein
MFVDRMKVYETIYEQTLIKIWFTRELIFTCWILGLLKIVYVLNVIQVCLFTLL